MVDWVALGIEYGEKVLSLIVSLIVVYVCYIIVAKSTEKALSLKAKSKKEKANIRLFLYLLRVVFWIVGFLVVIFVLTGSLAGLGVSAGLMTAALGWALQRPITGVAAWIMVILKKPFQIGDRIAIGDVKGDVVDITLTHIYLGEIGGTTSAEESSGRIILIPNAQLFELRLINYTLNDDYVLDEVITLVTYEGSLEKAIDICIKSAKKHIDEGVGEPHVQVIQKGSGVHLITRYRVQAENRVSTASAITQEIVETIGKTKDVEIAYPHRHIVK